MEKFKAFVNGKFIVSENKKWIDIIGPETNSPVGQVTTLSKDQVKEAFYFAKKAQVKWAKLPKKARANFLLAYADELEKHKEEIAHLMILEIAKGFKSSVAEVVLAAKYIRRAVQMYLATNFQKVIGEQEHGIKNKKVLVEWKPLGVITAIAPFNYPVNLSITKFIPALLTGNSVVYKSATNGTMTGAKISSLFANINFPPGVFNHVTGRGSEIGDEIVTNPTVKGISFTGSTKTGKGIATSTALSKLVLELGGKSPVIVLEDADLDLASAKIVQGAYNFSGQRCTAVKRILAHKTILQKLTNKIIEKVNNLTIGKAINNCDITALIDKKATDHVVNLYNDALEKGANFHNMKFRVEGNLVYPIVATEVTRKMNLYFEEQFGPILPIITINNDQEAIKVANDSEYGLQASVFTKDLERARLIADEIETGSVNVNSFPASGPIEIPFLGVKNSGFGVQNLPYALYNMMRLSNFVINE